MPIESSLAYFTPILAFLLVFTLVYAVLARTKVLGENSSMNAFLSFLIAMVFIIAPTARGYTLEVTPWIAVFLVSLFFFVLIISFVSGPEGILKSRWIGVCVILLLLAIFLVSGIHVFGSLLSNYLNINLSEIRELILNPGVLGALLLFAVAAALTFWFSKK